MDGHTGVLEILDMQAVLPSTMIEFYLTYFSIKVRFGSFPVSDKKTLMYHLSP